MDAEEQIVSKRSTREKEGFFISPAETSETDTLRADRELLLIYKSGENWHVAKVCEKNR